MNASGKPSGSFVTVLLKKAFVLSKQLGELRERNERDDQESLAAEHPADHIVFCGGDLGAKFRLGGRNLGSKLGSEGGDLGSKLGSEDGHLAPNIGELGLGCSSEGGDLATDTAQAGFQLGLGGGCIAQDQRDVLFVGEFDLRGSNFSDDSFGRGAVEAGRLDALDCGKGVEMHVHGVRDTTGRAMNPVRKTWLAIAASIGLILSGNPALAQATQGEMQAAQQDGNTFGKAAKQGASSIPDQQVTSEVVPGYQPAPANLSDLFGSDDGALNSAAGSAVGNDSWQTMMGADSNRARINPADLEDIRQRGQQINDSASTEQVGLGTPTNTPGTCEEVTKSTTQVTYEATCDKGVTVSEVAKEPEYSCPPGWTLTGTTCTMTLTQPADVSYTCPGGGSLSGQTCTQSQPATVSGYTCPSGFSLSGTNCSRTLTQAASVSGYSCPADYTLQGTTCVRTLQQSATPVYSCPGGHELSGTTCNATSTYQATPSYSCPAGWTLSGTICSQTSSVPATATSVCPSGYTLADGTCVMQTTYAATTVSTCPPGWILQAGQCAQSFSYNAAIAYTCPASFHMEGSTCWTNRYQCGAAYSTTRWTIYNGQEVCAHRKAEIAGGCSNSKFFAEARLWNDRYCLYRPETNYQCPKSYTDAPNALCPVLSYYSVPPTTNYSCPTGGNLSGTTCSGTNYTGAVTELTCPNGGTLSGSNCVVTQTAQPSISYSCAAGFTLSGTTCTQTSSQGAVTSYSCPSGGALTGTTCTVTSSQPAAVSYSCPSNWTLSGQTCTSTETQTATPIYTCPVGYSLSGSMCSKTEVQPATAQYACQAGFSLSGTTCSRSDPATASYSCPTGYVRTDTTCRQNLSQPASMTLVCPEGTSVEDGTCYGETAGQSDCQELEQNTQCTWLRDTCLDESQNGPCKVTERTFQCPVPGEPAKENKEYVCSGDLYCLNGSCQTIEREASSDFKDALVAMGAIDQTEKEFDPDKLGLFKGTRETCHKPVFGLVNCCAGKVSGLLSGGAAYAASLANAPVLLTAVATQFLTVFLCSKEEKMLDVKDRLGLCHFVGSYCSASFLGVCTTKKKAYCCFESKLTRILQEQGRPQINKPWAKPKEEKCEGFTVDEFSRLDMSKMDFSEIYSEFLEAAKLPNEAQMATDIQAKIQQYYQQNAPGGT